MYSFADPAASTVLETGESTLPRGSLTAASALVSGNLYLTYFTAQKTETINNVSVYCTIAASGTTVAQIGIFDLMHTRTDYTGYTAVPGDPKLSYWTTNDTTLFSASQKYTKALSGSWYKERGMRYALGVLWAGSAGPSLLGSPTISTAVGGQPFSVQQPVLAQVLTGQTQLYTSGLLGGARLASTARTLPGNNGVTNSTTTVTVSFTQSSSTNAQWGFLPDEVGLPISGTNIPTGASITAWNSFLSVTISAAATGTGSGLAGFVIGPAKYDSTTNTLRRIYAELTP